MRITEYTDQAISQDTEGYDDCGVSIATITDKAQLVVEYPTNAAEFISGIFYSSTNAISEMSSARKVINAVATVVEQDAEELEEEAAVIGCNIGISENITHLFKTSLEFTARHAEQLAELLPTKADFYQAAAAVAALASSVMAHDEEIEQQAKQDVAELEDDFEKVADAAELVREATQGTNNTKFKLNLA